MATVARVLANRYELRTEIGRGGMADVYVALDRLLNRRVAVKVLSPTFARDRSENLSRVHDSSLASGLYRVIYESGRWSQRPCGRS